MVWLTRAALAIATLAMLTAPALAAQPEPWGMGFQPAVTEIMREIRWFFAYTNWPLAAVCILVLGLLGWCALRYSASRNKVPSKTSHNTLVEVVWTIVPVLILVAIAIPSFRLLYNEQIIPEPEIAVKMTGAQWYWVYEYMDDEYADIPEMISYLLEGDARAEVMQEYNLTAEQVPNLLAVDYPLVVPVNKVVHVLTTGADVTHAVALPAFGIKADSWPGRINETWYRAEETGTYYGQCSQLCGRRHAYMPLEVRVVTQDRFDTWAEMAAEDIDEAVAQLRRWDAEDAGAGDRVAALTAD